MLPINFGSFFSLMISEGSLLKIFFNKIEIYFYDIPGIIEKNFGFMHLLISFFKLLKNNSFKTKLLVLQNLDSIDMSDYLEICYPVKLKLIFSV